MTSTRTTTLLPESDCNKYDYVIVGGGTAGTPPKTSMQLCVLILIRLCHCFKTCRILTT